jgi:hypothetical protein
MKNRIVFGVGVFVAGMAAVLALIFILSVSGCPSQSLSSGPGETWRITLTGIPFIPGLEVTYLILEAGNTAGAAAQGGNLNPSLQGMPVKGPSINPDGTAYIELFDRKEMISYLSALRFGYSLPGPPTRKAAAGSGRILATYADRSTGNSLSKKKIWGSVIPIYFNRNLTIRWMEGIDL